MWSCDPAAASGQRVTRSLWVFREFQAIEQAVAQDPFEKGRNRERFGHLVAEEKPPARLWRKGPGKFLRCLLLAKHERMQPFFVTPERFLGRGARDGELAREHVGGDHGERRTLAGEERRA